MNETKTLLRFFTVADFEEEEDWLREQHRAGWRLQKTVLPCFYTFERCEPEDVRYRLDYTNNKEDGAYLERRRAEGWRYLFRVAGWLYFYTPASEAAGEPAAEKAARADMISLVIRTRLLPLLVIFNCCLLPGFTRSVSHHSPILTVLSVILGLLVLLYVYLIVYCAVKLRRLRRKYGA